MKHFTVSVGVLFLLLAGTSAATAQTPKFEVGGQIFSFNSKKVGFGWGMGGRFTYNLNRHVAVDSELNAFLDDEGNTLATQGFAGAKVGVRNKVAGVFFKARPGFMTNFAKPAPNYATTFASERLDKFAFDVGAVVEFYANRHLSFRVDAGDVIIPFGNDPVVGATPLRPGTTHNFQYSLGLSLRF